MSDSIIETLRVPVSDRTGEYDMSVRLLQRFGSITPYLTRKKIAELWQLSSQHDVLFSDHTEGRLEPFLDTLLNPRGLWYEFFHLEKDQPVGVAYLTRVIPMFDADAHFAFWDGIASGRQEVVWELSNLVMDEYQLRRLSVAVPVYQSGTIRFVERLGFQQEGLKRDAVIHKGEWFPMKLFGLTRDELEEVMNNE